MSILRKQTRRNYTVTSNELIDADALSYRARGIAIFLLSKPDDWEIKIDYLIQHGTEGREAIRTALHELAEHGFLMRNREQDEGGKMRTVTRVADYPAFVNTGTTERRILGYDPNTEETDPPENRRSVSRTSGNRTVGKPEVLVNTEHGTTGSSRKHRRKNYSEPPPDEPRRKYSVDPDDY